jgi:hypothetical protein
MIDRRRTLLGLLGLGALGLPFAARRSHADEIEDKRLANRLELWSNYAKRTKNLVVRLTTTRETSLLREPLIVTGTLVFQLPGTLMLRDDGLAGSTTTIDDQGLRIRPNRPDATPTIVDRNRVPAAGWLGDRLRAAFAPGEGAELVADSRTEVPRGGQRLELLPLRDSAARKLVRSVSLHFDVVTGAVIEILIAEAQGDRLRLQLADHRQNVPDEDIDSLLTQ